MKRKRFLILYTIYQHYYCGEHIYIYCWTLYTLLSVFNQEPKRNNGEMPFFVSLIQNDLITCSKLHSPFFDGRPTSGDWNLHGTRQHARVRKVGRWVDSRGFRTYAPVHSPCTDPAHRIGRIGGGGGTRLSVLHLQPPHHLQLGLLLRHNLFNRPISIYTVCSSAWNMTTPQLPN